MCQRKPLVWKKTGEVPCQLTYLGNIALSVKYGSLRTQTKSLPSCSGGVVIVFKVLSVFDLRKRVLIRYIQLGFVLCVLGHLNRGQNRS